MTSAPDRLQGQIHDRTTFVPALQAEVARVIVGQSALVDRLLIGLLCSGHVLVEGVPGLAKTLAVRTLAEALDARFQRIQFTPDLLPADVIGSQVYHPETGRFSVRRGPVFANIVLADEINRAPAKVQSALLEAMQERQVTIGDATFPLDDPFLVMATQNPIEQEGTYRLPEAQVDRFMLKVVVSYPSRREERAILDRMIDGTPEHSKRVVSLDEIREARDLVKQVRLDDALKDYVTHLIHATREPQAYGLDALRPLIAFGASPRATIYLAQAARALAFLRRRAYVIPEDIKAVALDVLRHRVIVTYEAEAEEITPETIVERVLHQVEVP